MGCRAPASTVTLHAVFQEKHGKEERKGREERSCEELLQKSTGTPIKIRNLQIQGNATSGPMCATVRMETN